MQGSLCSDPRVSALAGVCLIFGTARVVGGRFRTRPRRSNRGCSGRGWSQGRTLAGFQTRRNAWDGWEFAGSLRTDGDAACVALRKKATAAGGSGTDSSQSRGRGGSRARGRGGRRAHSELRRGPRWSPSSLPLPPLLSVPRSAAAATKTVTSVGPVAGRAGHPGTTQCRAWSRLAIRWLSLTTSPRTGTARCAGSVGAGRVGQILSSLGRP